MLPPNEFGFALCRFSNGRLGSGPRVTGTPMNVNIPLACPQGSTFEGLFHTHPGGIALPSQTDRASAHRVGAKVLCISDDKQTLCHKP